jgi:L-histidine N-alpha-methyltransferase
MKTPQFVQLHHAGDGRLASEAAQGLLARPAAVSPKFFYDALGSRLFDAITELPSYYLTRTEAAVLARDGAAMGEQLRRWLGPAPVMVELGAGSCEKASRLFPLLTPTAYVAVDISVDHLRGSLACLQREHPHMDLLGLGMDFSAGFTLPPNLPGLGDGPRLAFYPGSSLGNFAPDAALQLLRDMRAAAQGGALLIGVDLVKPTAVLEAAYDDELGVTAAFNLNLLHHLNHLLGSDFRVPDWRHVAFFNAEASRIEMHLQARADLVVRWPGGQRAFQAGERMHTENSYKWTQASLETLLRDAGFGELRTWSDEQGWFAVCLARA